MPNLIFLDTETTAGELNEPIEVSFLSPDKPEWKSTTFFMHPEELCLPNATVIHGRSQSEIDQYPPAKEQLLNVQHFLEEQDSDTFIIGYNVQFDLDVLTDALHKYLGYAWIMNNTLDVLRLVRKLLSSSELGDLKLDTVYYHLFPDKLKFLLESRSQHSADVDNKLTKEILKKLWSNLSDLLEKQVSFAELCAYVEAPSFLKEWPFKKCKGQSVAKVLKNDPSYVKWFLGSDFRDEWPDLVYTINEIRKGNKGSR